MSRMPTQAKEINKNAIKELTDNFNLLTEYNTDYLEKRMSYSTLLAAMFCFNYFKNSDPIKMCEVIEKTAEAISKSATTIKNILFAMFFSFKFDI